MRCEASRASISEASRDIFQRMSHETFQSDTYTHIHTHTHTHTHIHTHTDMNLRTITLTHTDMNVRTHTHTHTHIVTYAMKMVWSWWPCADSVSTVIYMFTLLFVYG